MNFGFSSFINNRVAKAIHNKFNQAFFKYLGGGYTAYDTNASSYINYGYNINPDVYSMVQSMSNKTSAIPYCIKEVDDKKELKNLKRLTKSTSHNPTFQQKIKQTQLEIKAYKEGEMPMPLEKPNALQSWTEFFALYKTFIKTTGNVYQYDLKPEEGMNANTPIATYLLPSHMIQIVVKDNADMLDIESPVKEYILTEGDQFIKFKAEDVTHIKYSNPNFDMQGSHLYGQSPLSAALKNIQNSNLGLDLNNKTLKSGGAFGFIHGKGNTLTEQQALELKDRLKEMDASTENLARIAGVSAEVGFQRISLTSDELKPFDYFNFNEKKIADCLGWPLDDGKRGDFGGTIEQLRKQRITDNITPDLDLIADVWNEHWLKKFKGYEKSEIVFDASELPEMQLDVAKMVDWIVKLVNIGLITRNEGREVIRFMKLEDTNMDIITVASDIIPLEEAIEVGFGTNQVLE